MNRCPNCSCDYDPIPGCGPVPSRVLFIGERPSQRDNERGQVFVGPTGEELNNTYLGRCAGLYRDDVRLENIVRCWTDQTRTPSAKEVSSCAGYFLPNVIERVQPEVIVLMGGSACKIADKKIKLEMMRGVPQWNSIMDGLWEGYIFPTYSPARGMNDTSAMIQLLEDYTNLGKWLREEYAFPEPLHNGKQDHGLIRTKAELINYLNLPWHQPWRDRFGGSWAAIDMETHGNKFFSMQFSLSPGTARMILSEDRELFWEFNKWREEKDAWTIFHNAPGDINEIGRKGVQVNPARFRDTMQEAFHQCNLPQGLKALGYQLLGVEMRSWEDVVWPASITKMLDWMTEGLVVAQERLTIETREEMKVRLCASCGCRAHKTKCNKPGCGCMSGWGKGGETKPWVKVGSEPGALESVLKHALIYTAKGEDADEPYNPWKKLPEMLQSGLRGKVPAKADLEMLEGEIGPIPLLGIGNCTLKEAAEYALSDADYTGQIAFRLADLISENRYRIADVDVDDVMGLRRLV
jgi:uracil-DNA glycosylase family 4